MELTIKLDKNTAIGKLILNNLKLWEKENKIQIVSFADDTQYLNSSQANRKHILESVKQAESKKTKSIKTADLWK